MASYEGHKPGFLAVSEIITLYVHFEFLFLIVNDEKK